MRSKKENVLDAKEEARAELSPASTLLMKDAPVDTQNKVPEFSALQRQAIAEEVARQVAQSGAVPITLAQEAMASPLRPFDPTAPRIEFTLKNPKTGGWSMRKVSDPEDPILDKVELLGWRVSLVVPGKSSIRMDINRARGILRAGV